MKKNIISIIIEILIAFVYFYLFLPPINPTSMSFWAFIIFILLEVWFISSFNELIKIDSKFRVKLKTMSKISLFCFITVPTIILGIIIVNFVVSPIFNAKSYSKRILVDESGVFTNDIAEVDFNKIPLLDKDSSEKLGDRVMGQYAQYVSQFYVSDEYTQINYNDEILRVTPLEYDGLIKWLTNRKNGIGAYISVNSVTGEAKLITLEKGMHYLKSGLFNDSLRRKLRFSYPFTIMGESKFEVDNEGNPYYITPTLAYTGVNNKTRVTGVIILDPITGDSKKYSLDEIPSWVDNVYPASLVLEQVNDWGTYRDGFFNSIFAQKNVVNTTEGYNYLAMNDDIYLYTGITSVLSDESNLGFILTNLRTGKTVFYDTPGAEEYSAMDSAVGQVQQMNYTSTFPLLINLNNKPTYLVSLKDKAGLVKMYAFIDVKDYQKVSVTDSSLGIQKAKENYLNLNKEEISEELLTTKEITVKSITSAVIEANTYYYITDTFNNKYVVSIKTDNNLPFINVNDKITIMYYSEKDITEISKINY